jgi:hypothetical protein
MDQIKHNNNNFKNVFIHHFYLDFQGTYYSIYVSCQTHDYYVMLRNFQILKHGSTILAH